MGQVFDGYDEYGRPIYIDLAAEHKRTKPLAEAEIIEVIDKRRPLLFLDVEKIEIDTEDDDHDVAWVDDPRPLCKHCGMELDEITMLDDGDRKVWVHWRSYNIPCWIGAAATTRPIDPTTAAEPLEWKDAGR